MVDVIVAGTRRKFWWLYAGETEVQRKNGSYMRLSLWEGICDHCDGEFYVTAPVGCVDPKKNSNFALRTCPEHRSPRRSAMGRKGFRAGLGGDKIKP